MKKSLLLIIPLLLLLTGCQKSRTYFPPLKEMEPVEVHLVRFDSALLSLDTADTIAIMQGIRELYRSYPTFMPRWTEDIIGIPAYDTAYLCHQLPLFLNDTVYGFKQTNTREQNLFASVTDLEKDMSGAFTRLKHIESDIIVPDIYLFISGFNASIMFIDEDMAVGADMYLGSDYEYYNRVVYDYQKYTMRKECIPADVVSAYLFRTYPYMGTKNRLIDNMIYRGKMMYILNELFPTLSEAEVMGYTEEQWKWCLRYERAIWNLMMDKKDLFKTETIVLTSYLNDGPFTSEISQDAPARLGTWVGWRIVRSYMEENKDVTLSELLHNDDAETILEYSYYKP